MADPKPTAQCPIDGKWAATGQERADILEAYVRDPQSGALQLVTDHVGDLPNARQAPTAGHAATVEPISTWVDQPRQFHPQQGGLRMLIVDRLRYGLELPILRATFDDIVRKFKLSPKTLQSFDCDAGTYSRSYARGPSGDVTGIRIIVKAPQKREVANYGLSMHYNISDGVTTALLFGTDVIVCQGEPDHLPPGETELRNVELPGHPNLEIPAELAQAQTDSTKLKEHKKAEREKWHFDNIHQRNNPDNPRHLERPKDHFQRAHLKLAEVIGNHITALNHPLALPCLFLESHTNQIHEACEHGMVSRKTWEIMNELGMRSDDRGEENMFWIDAMALENAFSEQGAKDRFDAKKLTAKLDRHILRIMFSQRSPEWNAACSQFLYDLSKEINDKVPLPPAQGNTPPTQGNTPPTQGNSPPPTAPASNRDKRFKGGLHESLKESLEYNTEMSKSLLSRLETMKENMQLQLDVCGSITDQSINEFNARIAWDTSRDSTSMKILAVITAFFLPGTFVATFMSMSIWNWQWSDDPGPQANHQNQGVVSPHSTIYIKAAIPLTVATVLGWIMWWIYEIIVRENNYMKTVDANVDGSMVETWVRRALRWRRDMRAALALTNGNPIVKWINAWRKVHRVRKEEKLEAEARKKKMKEERKSKDRQKWKERISKLEHARQAAGAAAAPATGQANQTPAPAGSQQPNGSPV